MADDNGNGKAVKLAEHAVIIQDIKDDTAEIKAKLDQFITATATKREDCAKQFGKLETNTDKLWAVVILILAAVLGLIVL